MTSTNDQEGVDVRQPIIDMHMHAEVPAGTPAPCYPLPCSGPDIVSTRGDDTLRLTIEAMDRYNIVKALLSGDNLATVYRWAAADERFLPAPMIWKPGEPSADSLRPEYAAGRLLGMGEIGTQYSGFAPNDPAVEPYFALAEELDLPVLIHTLGIGARLPGFRCAAGNPLLLEEVLVRHPRLRLYVENAGFPYFAEMTAMMYQYPQLHADLSTSTWIIHRGAFHDYVSALVRAGLGKRLMFGSDQMQWPDVIGIAIDAIETAEFLTDEQKRDIFYNNAARFLRLSEAEIARHHGRAAE